MNVDPANPMDLKNPDLFVDDSVFGVFEAMRADGPVHWQDEIDGQGFWTVVGFDEATEVLQEPETFSADKRNGGNRIFDADTGSASPGRNLIALDAPDHTDLRRAIASSFSPAAVAALEQRIRARARRLVSRIAPAGHAEFVGDVAAPFTNALSTDLLGLPEDMAGQFGDWMAAMVADDDPDIQPDPSWRADALDEYDAYARKLFAGEIGTDGDLVANLANAVPAGVPVDFEDFSVTLVTLLVAMTDTTRNAISSLILALDRFPEQRALLLERRDLIPAATSEIIRWSTPLIHVRRTAMRDTQLAGRKIARGDKVVVWLLAADHDPQRFPDPGTFDVRRFAGRGVAKSLGFSAGPHFCLGWRFAELEVAAMIEALLDIIPDIRVEGEPSRLRSNFLRGIKRMPVKFTPVPA